MNLGLNSINGSIPAYIELMLLPFRGGKISKEKSVSFAAAR
jgi:hypothetical protein